MIITLTSAERREAVAVIRERYPKFNKSLFYKATNPDQYGVLLRSESAALLRQHFPEKFGEEEPETAAPEAGTKKHHASGGHRLTCRVQCRLEDDVYLELLRMIKEDGYSTTQSWLSDFITRFIAIRAKRKGEAKE